MSNSSVVADPYNVARNNLDEQHLAAALKATIDPNERENAENYLSGVQNLIGFAPTLLKVIVADQIECPIRQAGIIYLKNLITKYWDEEKPSRKNELAADQTAPSIQMIHEQDRHILRESMVDAIINSPEVIRVQLAVCVNRMIKTDYPEKWPGVVEKIVQYLHTENCQSWMGSFVVLYQLVKAYEFKKPEERKPLIDAMKVILPMIYDRMIKLMPDQSQEACYLQKFILKIFYALVQFSLNVNMMSLEEFSNWMEIVRQVVDRPVPSESLNVDEEDRPNLVWWKCKKWAVHLMSRIFERYGNPGQVSAEYNQFAEFYLKNFVQPAVETILKVLDNYRRQEYVSPRVLYQCLCYLQSAVSHSFSWKFLKPHMMQIVTDIIFPLASHNDQDEELWRDDPQEYIRLKYDLMDELINPSRAAVALLSESVKRKDVLNKTLQFLGQILSEPNYSSRQVDGALHMVGSLAPNLLKKKVYKAALEPMLETHIFPRFNATDGFLKARACWCIQMFSEIPFKNELNLNKALELVLERLLDAKEELPVKVEASLALQMLLNDQPKIEPLVEANINNIVLALLELIRETENDDLTSVVQKLIGTYTLQIIPLAVQIAEKLALVFKQLLENDDGAEDRAITAIGVLNTLEVVMDAVEEHPEITQNLEPVIIEVIKLIVDRGVMEFFEEAFILIASLILKRISDRCWSLLDLLYDVFKNQAGIDYFTDMMPALHSFVTVGGDNFLAVPARLEMVYQMCQQVLNEDTDEDAQCHAAKLLEVIILQFKGKIDAVIRPVCEIVLSRLVKGATLSELRTMCLQVLIAALHYNPSLLLNILQTFQSPDASTSVIDLFIKQWLVDTDCFLGVHDRKMYLIGLCTLMAMNDKPQVMLEMSQKLLPCCLTLYDGLQKAYELKALRENADASDDDSGEEEEIDEEALGSDEDEINEESQQYLERLAKSEQDSGNDDEFSDLGSDDGSAEETDLESYETVLDGPDAQVDEYVLFKQTLQHLQQNETQWYTMLIGVLNEEQTKSLQKVFNLADQRRAAAESRRIEQTGGYQFQMTQAPLSFNFGSSTFNNN